MAIPTIVTSELSIELTMLNRIPQTTRIALVQMTVTATSTIDSSTQRALRNRAKMTNPKSASEA